MLLNKFKIIKIAVILTALLEEQNILAAPSCSLSVVNSLSFGTYQPFNASANQSTATLKIKCTGKGDVNYDLSLSTGNSGSYFPRQMTLSGGTAKLQYNIYIASARNNIWGDGNSGTNVISNSKSSPLTKRHTVYGEIDALQTTAKIGSYSDLIIATLDF